MRKVVFGGANSLDNFFARSDDSVDWLLWGDEVAAVMATWWTSFDTILMGRRTFEVAVRNGYGAGYPGMENVVVSRTLTEVPTGVTLVRDDAAGWLRDYKARDGEDICLMGGGLLAHEMFEADLIDEIGFNVHPVLLGSGVPLYHPMTHQVDLELQECQRFANGCVYLTYRVKHRP